MSDRADAHIHLFEGGYQSSFSGRPGVQIEDIVCYDSLARDHNVQAALIVAYMGGEAYAGNNEYLARQAAEYPWLQPTFHVLEPHTLSVVTLEQWHQRGFVGVTFYLSSPEEVDSLQSTSDDVWSWLVDHRWLVSVNSKGEAWSGWLPVLQRHGDLRVVISHLGLPDAAGTPPSEDTARAALAEVLTLAAFPGPHVKLSGFYALTEPGYDYPHAAAWPYVEALKSHFGVGRLLWASDFPPCLDHLSFPQTFGLFAKMPFFSDEDRERVEGGNLLGLLKDVDRGE